MVILSPTEAEIDENIADASAVYQYVHDAFEQEHKLKWLQPLGFNNTYALMLPNSIAQKNNWEKVSDLPKQ